MTSEDRTFDEAVARTPPASRRASKKRKPPPKRLDESARRSLKAVVIDANVFGEAALPDLNLLRRISSSLVSLGIECWIHEAVVWEVAEHLARSVELARVSLASTSKQLRRALLDPGNLKIPFADQISTINAVIDAVGGIEHLTVIPTSGESAVAGLRDQILQLGPGERRDGVKTGASDSTWVRDSLARVGHDPSALIIASNNNKDVLRTCEALGISAPMVCSVRDLSYLLSVFSVAPEYLRGAMTRALLGALPWRAYDNPHAHDTQSPAISIDLGAVNAVSGTIEVGPEEWEVSEVELVSVDQLVAVTEASVEVDHEPVVTTAGSATVFRSRAVATLLLIGSSDIAGYLLNSDGQIEMKSLHGREQLISATVTMDMENGTLKSVNGTGDTKLDPTGSHLRYTDPIDAFNDARAMIELLPGIELTDNWPEAEGSETTFQLSGCELTISVTGDIYNEWSILAETRGVAVSIDCAYDPSTRVWAGSDSFDAWPPYTLLSIVEGVLGNPYNAIAYLLSVVLR